MERQVRIAFVVNRYPPQVGGLELHVQSLAQELIKRGHRVWVLTIAEEPGSRKDAGVEVLTGKSRLPIADVISYPSFGSVRSIARFLREERIDVVSTHTRFFPMSYVGSRAARIAGIPVVHTEHGSDFVASDSPVIALGSKTVDLTLGTYVLSHAERVVGVSEEAAAFAQRLGAARADVFYNAIAPTEGAYTGPDRPRRLVFVGRMVAGKGWDTYLDAVADLRGRGFVIDGVMLGGGSDLDAARQKAAQLGLDDAVRIAGRVSAAQVREELGGATLVNPTLLSEGFQTTLLEAIAERGRVVTFDVPGAQLLRAQGLPVRVTTSRTTEALVEALVAHLESPEILASPELIDAWTWPHRAQQYEGILRDVLAERDGS